MAYQSALQRSINGASTGIQQQPTDTLVNNLTQQAANTNNGLPVAPEQRPLPQVKYIIYPNTSYKNFQY